jgi:diadenosine tetraphosphate (Ap4A) HIT family hydrolase
MNHYRKTIHKYKRRQQSEGCPFCKPDVVANAVFENELVYIVPNLTQYDLWELHDVEDHLLLIPKRHVEALGELGQDERLAIMDVAAEYEGNGYSIYARGVGFVKRSIKHQHTHLIKVSNKKPRLALFLRQPYFLFKK